MIVKLPLILFEMCRLLPPILYNSQIRYVSDHIEFRKISLATKLLDAIDTFKSQYAYKIDISQESRIKV